jgi:hypothetical protein
MSPNFKETKQSLDHARTLAGDEVAVTPSLEGQVLQYSTGRVLTYVIPLLLQRVISPAMMRSSTPWLTKCAVL